MISFSFIIPVYNRPDDLEALLESLGKQTYPAEHFEAVIIDDGSDVDIQSRAERFINHAAFSTRYFRQDNQGPGTARNLGMEKAENSVIIFIDSDCIAPPQYLQAVADAFQELDMDVFGGPDTSLETFSSWDKAVNYVMTSFLTTGGLRGSGGKKLARFYPRSFNMGFKKTLYDKIGGFGSIYHYGEDIEFSRRLLNETSEVSFLPDAFVYHKRRSGPVSFARQIYKMGKARIQLAAIDKTLLEPLYLIPAAGILILAAILIAALFTGLGKTILIITVTVGLIWLFFLSLHGLFKTKSLTTAVLVPVAFTIQMFSYGFGVIGEAVRRFTGLSEDSK